MAKFDVEFTYFKKSGKYYSDGKATLEAPSWYDVVELIKTIHKEGNLPGLVSGAKEFHIMADIAGVPALFVLDNLE